MKNLIFKEFKLSIHPICYLFVLVFPACIFAPSYPIFVSFIYVCCCLPILFLGANKGQQSNDLYYTSLLPVRKKDIVLARIISVSILIAVNMAVIAILCPAAKLLFETMRASNPEALAEGTLGLEHGAIGSVFGFGLVCYGISNLIFFSMFYKNGRAIVGPTLVSIITFSVLSSIFCILLPKLIGQFETFCYSTLGNILIFFLGIISYGILSYFNYRVSSNNLEKVDL